MRMKLALRMDPVRVQTAKAETGRRGRSVSQIVGEFLRLAVILLGVSGCDDSWKQAAQVYGVTRSTVLELTQDLYLYCYCGEYQLVWPECAAFTMAEFRKDPRIGVVDPSANIAFVAIVPAGSKVHLTRVRRPFDWNGGSRRTLLVGTLSGSEFAGYKEIVITRGLFERSADGDSKYLRVATGTTNQSQRNMKDTSP